MNDEKRSDLENFYHSYRYIILIILPVARLKSLCQNQGLRPTLEFTWVYIHRRFLLRPHVIDHRMDQNGEKQQPKKLPGGSIVCG